MTKRDAIISSIVVLVLANLTVGQNIDAPAQRLAAVQKDVADAAEAWRRASDANKTRPENAAEVKRLAKAADEKTAQGISAAIDIAKSDPRSDVALDALEWVIVQTKSSPAAAEAIDLMTRYQAANPRIAKTVALVSRYIRYAKLPSYPKATELLNAVSKDNPDKNARGQAALGIALRAKDAYDLAETAGSPQPELDALAKKAEDTLLRVVNDFADCKDLTGRWEDSKTLGQVAGSSLYEVQHLRIGQPAIEIEAEDLDGKRFKLSDYRGKVVMLVFWASWCGPCMADVPHERKLVEKFRDRPFVMIGVNGDDDRQRGVEAVAKAQINWRSFWGGPHHNDSPIAVAWNVEGWPTVYVIDQDGLIRIKNTPSGDLDQALETLVGAAAGPTRVGGRP